METKRVSRIVLATALLLLVPLAGTLLTDGVAWGPGDFVAAGALMMGMGFLYELGARKVITTRHRAVLGAVLLAVFLTAWAELAVGVFGTPVSGD